MNSEKRNLREHVWDRVRDRVVNRVWDGRVWDRVVNRVWIRVITSVDVRVRDRVGDRV